MTDRLNEGLDQLVSFIARIVNIVSLAIVLFLFTRIVLRLFGASASSPFVSWIYNVSGFLITPFRGILPTTGAGQFSIDTPAIVALVMYVVISYVIIYLLSMLRPTHHAHEAHTH